MCRVEVFRVSCLGDVWGDLGVSGQNETNWLNSGFGVMVWGEPGRQMQGQLEKGIQTPMAQDGPPDHHDDRVNSDQEVVNKGISLCGERPWVWGEGHFPVWQRCVGVGETGDVGEDLGVCGPWDKRDVRPAHMLNYYGT